MSVTRKVHVVRCTDAPQDDPTNYSRWVDVLVLDAIALLGPSGKEFVFDCAAKNAVPTIIDNTGDGASRTPGNATRLSHMERLTNADDSTLFLDVEILDAFALRGPNGAETVFDMRKPGATNIVDNTDLNLGQTVADASRRAHVFKIEPSDQPTTQELMQGATPANPTSGTSGTYLAVLVMDAVAFSGPIGASEKDGGDPIAELRANGEMLLLAGNSDFANSASWNDTTQYDDKGAPPVNSDPHIYVRFPTVGGSVSGSPWLGSNPTSDQNPDRSGPLCQGLLWQIINASDTPIFTVSVVVTVPPGDVGGTIPWGSVTADTCILNPFLLAAEDTDSIPLGFSKPDRTVSLTKGADGWLAQTACTGPNAKDLSNVMGPGIFASGSNFDGPVDGTRFGDYWISNIKGLQRSLGQTGGSIQFQMNLEYGPADANKFQYTIQFATWAGTTEWKQDAKTFYLMGGKSGKASPADSNTSSWQQQSPNIFFDITIDLSTLKLTVSGSNHNG
jgi:hypothetical protein